jgi:hypothetical protein
MDNTTENPIAKMPESIAKAIIDVMGNIKKIGKANNNTFDKYLFASIDDFIENVNPLCAAAGLIIIQEESIKPELMEKSGKNGKVLMLWCEFNFTLGSVTGDLYGPITKSVFVQATGAQAFGSAQSYALKQFMRSLFQIATGDGDDPDNKATQDISNPPTIDVKKIATGINRSISKAKNKAELDNVSVKYNDDLLLVKSSSQTAYDFLMDAIKKRGDEINIHVNNMDEQHEADLKAPE